MSAELLRLHLARVRYGGHDALTDVALSVRAGEIVGIAGHVGAGKTTLALAAAGLLRRASQAEVHGEVVHPAGGDPAAAFVFANPWTQLTDLGGTVEEEVAVGPENLALAPPEMRRRVDRALVLVEGEALALRIPRELSGGEMQRVALASALALEAPLVVLDEPTAQLDPEASGRFAGALRALAADGRGVLLVEQDLRLLTEVASRVIVLADGRVIAEGDPRELFTRRPPLDARLGSLSSGGARRATRAAGTADGAPVLEVRDLTAGYPGREVLRGITLALAPGTSTAWLGANGAGKSTLARAIMGLVPARSGSVIVNGEALDALPVEQRARLVGLVFQDPASQLFGRTVLEETLFGPKVLGLPREVAVTGAWEALRTVGLEGEAETNPADLSPQAQRRVAIAAAMAARPPLLILDEPTAGQDAAGRGWIARALERQETLGAAAVITHDLDFAQRHCGQSVTLTGGQVSDIRS